MCRLIYQQFCVLGIKTMIYIIIKSHIVHVYVRTNLAPMPLKYYHTNQNKYQYSNVPMLGLVLKEVTLASRRLQKKRIEE